MGYLIILLDYVKTRFTPNRKEGEGRRQAFEKGGGGVVFKG